MGLLAFESIRVDGHEQVGLPLALGLVVALFLVVVALGPQASERRQARAVSALPEA